MSKVAKRLFRRALSGLRLTSTRHLRPRETRGGQRGFILIESLVALAILGSATAATLTSLSAGALTTNRVALRGTADWIATSQVSTVQDAAFVPTPGTYAAVTVPADFVVSNTTAPVTGGDGQIQAVTITVTYQGSVLLSTEVIKVDR